MAQVIFMSFHRNQKKILGMNIAKQRSYVEKAIRNKICETYRKHYGLKGRLQRCRATVSSLLSGNKDADELVELNSDWDFWRREVINRFGDLTLQILVCREAFGLSIKETSAAIGISDTAVKNRLKRFNNEMERLRGKKEK